MSNDIATFPEITLNSFNEAEINDKYGIGEETGLGTKSYNDEILQEFGNNIKQPDELTRKGSEIVNSANERGVSKINQRGDELAKGYDKGVYEFANTEIPTQGVGESVNGKSWEDTLRARRDVDAYNNTKRYEAGSLNHSFGNKGLQGTNYEEDKFVKREPISTAESRRVDTAERLYENRQKQAINTQAEAEKVPLDMKKQALQNASELEKLSARYGVELANEFANDMREIDFRKPSEMRLQAIYNRASSKLDVSTQTELNKAIANIDDETLRQIQQLQYNNQSIPYSAYLSNYIATSLKKAGIVDPDQINLAVLCGSAMVASQVSNAIKDEFDAGSKGFTNKTRDTTKKSTTRLRDSMDEEK